MVIDTDIWSSGNAVEQDLHVLDGVDGHAGLADIADDARVVGVVAAVGRQVEGDREAGLPGGQVAAVEGVGFLGRGEARVLAHRPRAARVHGGARPARIGREARQGIQVLECLPGPRPCTAPGRRCLPECCQASSSAGWPPFSLAASFAQSAAPRCANPVMALLPYLSCSVAVAWCRARIRRASSACRPLHHASVQHRDALACERSRLPCGDHPRGGSGGIG